MSKKIKAKTIADELKDIREHPENHKEFYDNLKLAHKNLTKGMPPATSVEVLYTRMSY